MSDQNSCGLPDPTPPPPTGLTLIGALFQVVILICLHLPFRIKKNPLHHQPPCVRLMFDTIGHLILHCGHHLSSHWQKKPTVNSGKQQNLQIIY